MKLLPGSGGGSSGATLGANTFTATQTITPAANTSAVTITGYSVTGSGTTGLESWSGTLNTSGAVTVLNVGITNTASNAASKFVDFNTGSGTQFSVLLTGKVGIGTGSPTAKLHLYGGAAAGGSVPSTWTLLSSGTGAANRIGVCDGDKTFYMNVLGSAPYAEFSTYDYGAAGPYAMAFQGNGGNIGISGVTAPTAKVHIAAGTATASTAPLKFTSGTNLTTPEAGAMEYNGTNLLFTRAGTTREGVLTQSAVTTEVLISDTSVTVNIGGTTYKLLARA